MEYDLSLDFPFKMKKTLYILSMLILLAVPFLQLGAAGAVTTITITSPGAGASITGSSFNVAGTATAYRNISVKVNGAVVGTTTSDGSGNWSLVVTGQSPGTKNIQAVASYSQLYINSLNVGSLSNSVMNKINPVSNSLESTFSIYSNNTAPLFWVPNGDFTKAYGAAGPLGSPYVYAIDLTNDSTSSFLMTGTSPNPGIPAFNSDYSKVYIPDADGFNDIVHVYNTSTNAEIGSGIAVGDCASFAAHRPGTNQIWVSNQCDNTISVIDSLTDTVTNTYATPASVTCLSFTPDGARLYAAQCATTMIYEMDANSGTVLDSTTVSSGAIGYALAMNSDGSKLYIPNIVNNSLDVLDTSTNTISQVATVGSGPLGVVVSPENTRAYVSNANAAGGFNGSTISVIDLTTNSVIETISVAVAPSVGWFAPLESTSSSVNFTLAGTLADTGSSAFSLQIIGLVAVGMGLSSVTYLIRRWHATAMKNL